LKEILVRFARDDSGATAIEYGLIAAGIAAVIIVAVNNVGTKTQNAFTRVNNNFGK
jgi:pilus assembly protein Flp/PilA